MILRSDQLVVQRPNGADVEVEAARMRLFLAGIRHCQRNTLKALVVEDANLFAECVYDLRPLENHLAFGFRMDQTPEMLRSAFMRGLAIAEERGYVIRVRSPARFYLPQTDQHASETRDRSRFRDARAFAALYLRKVTGKSAG